MTNFRQMPETELDAEKSAHREKWRRMIRLLLNRETLSRVVFLLGPPASYCGVELMNKNNPFTSLTLEQITFNLLWYYLVFWLVRMLTGRRNLAAGLSACLFFAIGLVNHYVLIFRGRVIFPCDLLSFRTAVNVAQDYDYTPDKTIYRAAAIFAVYLVLLIVAFCVSRRRGRQKLKWQTCLVSLALTAVFLFVFFGTGLLPAVGIYSQQWKTQQNGFVLNFMTSLSYSFVRAPKEYSSAAVQEIAKNVDSDTVEVPAAEQPTHLIVIMNESFADLTTSFPNLELTDDPMPFYHSLTKNTVKGTMYSPVTGGGTANVEFEYLTGDSLAFLPSATVAYQLYLYNGAPSMVSQLKALGYRALSFHPYLASGWNRTSVYSWLGFDQQYYQDDVQNSEYIRGYVSDSSDYQQLYRMTDEDSGPLFLFNVTMQNHSGYQQGWYHLDRTVDLAGDSIGTSNVASQYFSLIRESDNALKELINHYQNSDERTMIVFFGDHQPPLENEFYEALYGKRLDDRSTKEVLQQYGVPFFIWANYDIPEQQNVQISTNFLSTLTAELAGFPLTDYQKLHAELMQKLPVATTVGFMTADGTVTNDESTLDPDTQKLYEDYRIMAYNHLFDKSNHPDGFFG